MSSLTRHFTRRSAVTSSHFLTSPLHLSTSRPFHKANYLSALSESDHGRREFPHLCPLISRLSQKGNTRTLSPALFLLPVLKQSKLTFSTPDDSVKDQKAEIDQHKEELLRNQKDGKGKWKGELSSNSEAAVCFSFFLDLFFGLYSSCQQRPSLGVEKGD